MDEVKGTPLQPGKIKEFYIGEDRVKVVGRVMDTPPGVAISLDKDSHAYFFTDYCVKTQEEVDRILNQVGAIYSRYYAKEELKKHGIDPNVI